MNPSPAKDYEIDILIGKIASILLIVFSIFRFVRAISSEGKIIFLFGTIFFIFFIFVPCLYLYSLHKYKVKLARLSFRIWFIFFFVPVLVCDR
jgi:hypothetical protein